MVMYPVEIDKKLYYKMKKAELTDLEVCEELFISLSTLSKWKRREGVRYPKHTVEDYIRLRKEGMNDKEIAKKWKFTAKYLWKWKTVNTVPREFFREY